MKRRSGLTTIVGCMIMAIRLVSSDKMGTLVDLVLP